MSVRVALPRVLPLDAGDRRQRPSAGLEEDGMTDGRSSEAGQATIEAGRRAPAPAPRRASIALQLLLAGYSLTLADGAAEAGTLAVVAGRDGGARRPRSAAGLGRASGCDVEARGGHGDGVA